MDERYCLLFGQKYRRRRLEEHPLEQQIDCFQHSQAGRKILQQRKLIDYFDGTVLISTHIYSFTEQLSHHLTRTIHSISPPPLTSLHSRRQWEQTGYSGQLGQQEDESYEAHDVQGVIVCPAGQLEVGEGVPLVVVGGHHARDDHSIGEPHRGHADSEGAWKCRGQMTQTQDCPDSLVDPEESRLKPESEMVE